VRRNDEGGGVTRGQGHASDCLSVLLNQTHRAIPLVIVRGMLVLCISMAVSCQVETPVGDPRVVATRLAGMLDDPSEHVRRTAALSLGKIGHVVAATALERALSDPDPVVREYSAWALGRIGEAVGDTAAVRLVGALGDPRFAACPWHPPLLDSCARGNDRPEIGKAAARALGNIGPRRAVLASLTEILAGGTRDSRRAAVEALAQLEAPGTYPALVTALTDPDPAVRQGAIAALGELADRRALAEFRRLLLRDADVGVRAEAAYRIGKLGDPGDVTELQWAATHDAALTVRLWAAWARDALTGDEDGSATDPG